jgi:anti-sigma B factor antagonist
VTYNVPMLSEPLTIERLAGPGQGVLRLKGPLTTQTLSPFQNAVRGEDALTMILDFTEVPYIDSAGLGSLVSTFVSRHKAGRRVALVGVNKRVSKVFEVTRVDSLFLQFKTLDEAIEALTSAGHA